MQLLLGHTEEVANHGAGLGPGGVAHGAERTVGVSLEQSVLDSFGNETPRPAGNPAIVLEAGNGASVGCSIIRLAQCLCQYGCDLLPGYRRIWEKLVVCVSWPGSDTDSRGYLHQRSISR